MRVAVGWSERGVELVAEHIAVPSTRDSSVTANEMETRLTDMNADSDGEGEATNNPP